jgi:hypothetical protein
MIKLMRQCPVYFGISTRTGIAKSAEYSYEYSFYVLEGPFKLGEAAIAASARYSCVYAADVLKGPFKAGEAAIAKDDSQSYFYAVDALKGPFKPGEPVIALSNYYKKKYEKLVGYKI